MSARKFGGIFYFPLSLPHHLRDKLNMRNMKKEILLVALFSVVAVASLRLDSKRENSDSLTLENIEALATDELKQNTKCFGSGSVDCPKDQVKVYFVSIGKYAKFD